MLYCSAASKAAVRQAMASEGLHDMLLRREMANWASAVDTLRKIRIVLLRMAYSLPTEVVLAFLKHNQKRTFETLKQLFPSYYGMLSTKDCLEFVAPTWEKLYAEAEAALLPYPPFAFLRSRIMQLTMVLSLKDYWLPLKELKFLEGWASRTELKRILLGDYVGRPFLVSPTYVASSDSINYLYHLYRWERSVGVKVGEVGSIIEWGGGYGDMAKLVQRIRAGITYTIIDLPLFSCLQWLYLSSVLGQDAVHLLLAPTSDIQEGKINLLPLCFLRGKALRADLFIATWSLSESSAFAQDYVSRLNFFGAKHLILAFQKRCEAFPDAERLRSTVAGLGLSAESMDFLPDHYYVFR